MSAEEASSATVAAFTDPAVGLAEANEALDEAWAAVLATPSDRAAIADLLGVDENALPERCPFEVRTEASGLTTADYLVIANLAYLFAKDVAWDLAKDGAKEAFKVTARKAWTSLVMPKAEGRLPHQGLGLEKPLHDDVQ